MINSWKNAFETLINSDAKLPQTTALLSDNLWCVLQSEIQYPFNEMIQVIVRHYCEFHIYHISYFIHIYNQFFSSELSLSRMLLFIE